MEFKRFCCFCLTKNNKLVDVQTYDVDNISFCVKIAEIMPENLQYKFEGHPTMICGKCKKKINNFYNFIQDALKAYEILKKPYSVLWSGSTTEQNNKTELRYENSFQDKIDTNNEIAMSNLSCSDKPEATKVNFNVQPGCIVKKEPASDLQEESSVVYKEIPENLNADTTRPLDNPAGEEENLDNNYYDNIENRECEPFEIYELKPCIETLNRSLEIEQPNHEDTYILSTNDDININNSLSSSDPLDYRSELDDDEDTAPAGTSLPEKSKDTYEHYYRKFMDWRKNKNTDSFSENIIMDYFYEISNEMKSSTLWKIYSVLKTTINVRHNVDLATYTKLRAFLKKQSRGYVAKKSKTLTVQQIKEFILKAPDNIYLATKVALIVGIMGACGKQELWQMQINHIQDTQSAVQILIPDTKTKATRKFSISGYFYNIFKKYLALRPSNVQTNHLFLNYQKGRCTKQVIGINKFGYMPKQVAKFLNLTNPELYTGHCFRRTSATMLMDVGDDITTLIQET